MKGSRLDVFSRYLQAQVALPENVRVREPQPLAITISREAGTGGIIIAELLAQRLMPSKRQQPRTMGRF